MNVHDLPTPALVIDHAASRPTWRRWPAPPRTPAAPPREGPQVHRPRRRPGPPRAHHVHLRHAARGGRHGAAGLGRDLLLANEVLDPARLGAMAPRRRTPRGDVRITVAVDCAETVDAAAAAGMREVLVDVDIGLPRCGCPPERRRPHRRPRPREGLRSAASWATRAT